MHAGPAALSVIISFYEFCLRTSVLRDARLDYTISRSSRLSSSEGRVTWVTNTAMPMDTALSVCRIGPLARLASTAFHCSTVGVAHLNVNRVSRLRCSDGGRANGQFVSGTTPSNNG